MNVNLRKKGGNCNLNFPPMIVYSRSQTFTLSHTRNRMKKHPRPAAPLPLSKKRLYMSITVALPFLLFIVVELGLRLFSYGPDLSLFVTESIGGKPYYRMNPAVKDRYFSRFTFTPTTSMDYFEMPKPKGVYRIFCLGGSTTVGYPYWYNGSFSSFLRDQLFE